MERLSYITYIRQKTFDLKKFKWVSAENFNNENYWNLEFTFDKLIREAFDVEEPKLMSLFDYKLLHKNSLNQDIDVFIKDYDFIKILKKTILVACKQQIPVELPLEFIVDLILVCFLKSITQLKINSSDEPINIQEYIDNDLLDDEEQNLYIYEENEMFLDKEDFTNLEKYFYVNNKIFYKTFVKNSFCLNLVAYCFDVDLEINAIQRIFYIIINLLVKYNVIKQSIQTIRKGSVSKTIINYGIEYKQYHINLLSGYTPLPSITLNLNGILIRYGWSSISVNLLMIQNPFGYKQSKINPSGVFILDSVCHKIDYQQLELSDDLFNRLLKLEYINIKKELETLKNKIKEECGVYKKITDELTTFNKLLKISNKTLLILGKLDGIITNNVLKKKIDNKLTKKEYIELLHFWENSLSKDITNIDYYKKTAELLKDKNISSYIMEDGELNNKIKNKYPKLKLKNFPGSLEISKLFSKKLEIKSNFLKLKNDYLKLLARKRTIQQFKILLELLKHKNFNNFYLQHFLDFRGRIYSKSYLSTINTKWLRSIYFYGEWTEAELKNLDEQLLQSKTYNIISKYFDYIKVLNLQIVRPVILQAVVWCLVDIAKFYKSTLIADSKISLETFLKFGIKIFKENTVFPVIDNNLEFEEILEINKTITILHELIKGKISKKYFLSKDSTASVLQHLFKLIGVKNEKALQICNIDGIDVWTDPYTVILEDFLKTIDISENSQSYFTRSNLKKVMMTYHYSASYYTSLNYFLQACKNKKNNFKIFSKEVENELKKDFIKFFDYLRKQHETKLLYEVESVKLTENIKDLVFQDQSVVSLLYYKTKNTRFEVKLASENLRTSFTSQKIQENIVDKTKTSRAYRANTVHACDANYARKVLDYLPILVVHDSFAPSIQQISLAIDKLNEIYKERILVVDLLKTENAYLINKSFSIFIVL